MTPAVHKLRVFDVCPVVGYYATYSGNSLSTRREKLSVISSRLNKFLDFWKWDRQVVPKRQ